MSSVEGLESLSVRAAENVTGIDHWAALVDALATPWSSSNPDGMVILGLAENGLMHDEVERHIKDNFEIDRSAHFTYGHGPQGSHVLLQALSNLFNTRFHPKTSTKPSEFQITDGVTSMIDSVTWSICNPGDGILFPQPLYTGFPNDVTTRSRGVVVPVSFEREDGTLNLDDVFDAEANLRCLELALQNSEKRGTMIKGVMVTNPHNPLGKCYPVETLRAIAKFCATHNIHYLSDEIYALSTYSNPAYPNAIPFTSILSLNLDSVITPSLVHVLYGAAKDFCANGLRLGAFYTRNTALRDAMRGLCVFGWVPYIVQDMWARILLDEAFLENFVAENQRRLSKNYAILTSFLDQYRIPYYQGGNAGFFVWIDLRRFLLGAGDGTGTSKDLRFGSPDIYEYSKKENQISERCMRKGVWITKGSNCRTEEVGWFRVVFTAQEEALKVGLNRLITVLEEMKATGEL